MSEPSSPTASAYQPKPVRPAVQLPSPELNSAYRPPATGGSPNSNAAVVSDGDPPKYERKKFATALLILYICIGFVRIWSQGKWLFNGFVVLFSCLYHYCDSWIREKKAYRQHVWNVHLYDHFCYCYVGYFDSYRLHDLSHYCTGPNIRSRSPKGKCTQRINNTYHF